MADLYVRIDDRLIHGQTIVAWCPTLQIKEIVAVDDVSAKNPMLKTIMTMGVPSTYKTHIAVSYTHLDVYKRQSLSYPRQDGHRPSYMLMEIDKEGEAHFALNFL